MKETDSIHTVSSHDDVRKASDASIMKKIPEGAEATTVLVGSVDFLEQPTIAFVRLAEGTVLPTLLEHDHFGLGTSSCQVHVHTAGSNAARLGLPRDWSFHLYLDV